MTPIKIQDAQAADLAALREITRATDLFPESMLGQMIARDPGERGDTLCLTCRTAGAVVGFGYLEAEVMTEGTWNLRALAIHPDRQGSGFGSALLAGIEGRLRTLGHRLLIVETSGTKAFEDARRFYAKTGYTTEATLTGFWAEGDDKIIFAKRLR